MLCFTGCGPEIFQLNYGIFPDTLTYVNTKKNFQESSPSENFYHVAVGNNGRIFTSEGRVPLVWTQRNSMTTQKLNFVKFSPISTDSLIVIAAGNAGTILRSLNGGINWNLMPSNTTNNLNGISYTVYSEFYAVGDSGTIIKTSNLGNNWVSQQSGVSNKLLSVFAIDLFYAIAVGEKGTVLQTTNRGVTWINRTFDTTKTFNRVFFWGFWGAGRIWIAGNNGVIYTSANAVTWSLQQSNTSQDIKDIYFKNATSGIIVGNGGTIRYTTNAGVNWQNHISLDTLTTRNITSISQIDTSAVIGTAGSATMELYRDSLVSILNNNNTLPEKYCLYQNYPNPFNPVTKIRFQTPLSPPEGGKQVITLIIYDILGREVASLIPPLWGGQEGFIPGTYEVDWNASNYPSGVYFYKIISGDYIDTKKMILIK